MAKTTKTLAEITAERPPNEERVREYRRAMQLDTALHDLRRRRGVTQTDLAATLEVSRANVGRIENELDVRVSTLARFVEGIGGRLAITAVFPDDSIPLAGGEASDAVTPAEPKPALRRGPAHTAVRSS